MKKEFKTIVPISVNLFKGERLEWLIAYAKRNHISKFLLTKIGYSEDVHDQSENGFPAFARDAYEMHRRLKENGIDSGVWLGTFLSIDGSDRNMGNYQIAVGRKGEPPMPWEAICPLDEMLIHDLSERIKIVAKAGVKDILLDDDLRVQFICSEPKCFCEKHMQRYREYFSEEISREELVDKIFAKREKKYVRGWLKVNADSLREFCGKIRAAADEVGEDVNVNTCCGPSDLWQDFDGAGPQLGKILSGKNPTYLRLSGGPYWDMLSIKAFEMELPEVIDYARRQAKAWKNLGMTIVAEGDAWPHYRWITPANHVENFDFLIRADGNFDGNQKYIFEYQYPPEVEQGYFKLHERNVDRAEFVTEAFSKCKTWGINPYKSFYVEDYAFKERADGALDLERQWIKSYANRYLNYNAVSVSFEDDAPCMVFGRNAIATMPVNEYKKGLILDYEAAKYLYEQGIDVGLEKIEEYNGSTSGVRLVSHGQEVILDFTGQSFSWVSPKIKKGATAITQFKIDGVLSVAAYTYENADGLRFAVIPYDMENADNFSAAYKSYTAHEEILQMYEFVAKRKAPVRISGYPYLYTIVKERENGLCVGLLNFSRDTIYDLSIKLNEKYSSVKCVEGESELKERTCIIKRLGAQEFCALEFEK